MRRLGFKIFLGSLLLAAFFGSPAWAYFFDYGDGVRPAGMGRAFVAVADDVNTVNWNPAGLAAMDRVEITTMYASLFAGLQERLYTGQSDALSYSYVAASVPVDPVVGYFGASWSEFNSMLYHENIFDLAYARTVIYKSQTFYVGGNLKSLSWNVPSNDYTEALSKTGVTADLSVLYPLPRSFTAGICWENIIPADVGVDTYENVPQNLRLGLSWKQDLSPLQTILDSVLVSTEFDNRSYDQGTNTFHAGVESRLFHGLAAVRVGVDSTEFTVGLGGSYTFPQINMTTLQMDYSFALPFYVENSLGTHRVSLTASWGQQPPKPAAVVPAPEQKLEITPEENLAAERERELALSRAAEAARLKAMMDALQADIARVRAALDQVNELVKLGQTPAIQFQPGKAVLVKNSFATLDKFGAVLEKYPSIKVRVEGHTDSQGKPKVNLRLSQTRVEAVKEYLRGRFKIVAENLVPVGYGDTHPLGDNLTAEGRAANRRVELKVLIPAGLEIAAAEPAGNTLSAAGMTSEPVRPEDIVRYDDLEKQKEKVKVYEMQMNPKDVEDMFNQQHRQDNAVPAK
jgi:outer membrane protein OmpA-like peptidoglycan-associated protein